MDEKDISIVVQGPVFGNNVTKNCLSSLRKLFPNSKIIFSTWKNSDVSGLEFDVLVENDDPGAKPCIFPPKGAKILEQKGSIYKYEFEGKVEELFAKDNNGNRLLVSTKNGLEKVDTEYVLKLRSDIIFTSKKFLKYWDKFPEYNGKYKIFKRRIINNANFSSFANVGEELQLLPFHMSDWIHFGLSEDVKLLFSCPFQDEKSACDYFDENRPRKNYEPFPLCRWQYPPETYILVCLVKDKFPQLKYENTDDYNEQIMRKSNMLMADNFIMLDQDQLSFEMEKYPFQFFWFQEFYNGLITHQQWQYLYKIYCDNNYKFFDYDYKRLFYLLSFKNLPMLVKYPRRYFKHLASAIKYFDKKELRKAFVMN